jgi:hypothetical protein
MRCAIVVETAVAILSWPRMTLNPMDTKRS